MTTLPEVIFHLTTQQEWEEQIENPDFEALSLKIEGFIHASLPTQKQGVLERYFVGQSNILCLEINPLLLTAELKLEQATNKEFFPHIYGKINKNAIVSIEKIA